MLADDRLILLLRALQTFTNEQDTPRLLSTASYLLATLSNPLNLTVVSAQLLSAPAIWTQPEGLRTCLRFIGVFQSAALTILRHEDEEKNPSNTFKITPAPVQPVIGGNLTRDVWVKSVVQGADDRSPRWRHCLLFAGLLLGFGDQDKEGLSRSLKSMLNTAFVDALKLALVEARNGDDLGANAVAIVLNYIFPLLTDHARSQIDYDMLLPILVGSAFFSSEGYRGGYFLANVDQDVAQVSREKFSWPGRSASFSQIDGLSRQPLITGMGPLSRVIAHTVEHCKDSFLVQAAMDDILRFSQTIMTQWQRIKLSEVDVSEEKLYFDDGTLTKTLPVLWKILRSALFAVVVILRSCMMRVVNDGSLANDEVAPVMATQALLTLRHLYFIAARLGPNSSSQYIFVYLTAIDVLAVYPTHSESFIKAIAPTSLGRIPQHPLDRTLDLYFLNTAEHFSLTVSPKTSQEILLGAAAPYLEAGANPHLLDILEAAHSVTLSVISSPKCIDLAGQHLPFYVNALFSAFPRNLSSRQFRFAFKTLLRITTAPSPLSMTHPDFAETLLDIVHQRALANLSNPTPSPSLPPSDNGEESHDESTTLTLTLIDGLPYLPYTLLEQSLPLVADLIGKLSSPENRKECQDRFWDVVSNGEMDIDRNHLCLAWWTSRGGREMILSAGMASQDYLMSGALRGGEPGYEPKL